MTGASGFIGSNLCRRLVDLGAEVHAVSRDRQHRGGNLRWRVADFADIGMVRMILERVRPDVVFHLAGVATGVRDPEFVLPCLRNNLLNTVNLLLVTRELECSRIILAGSLEEPADAFEAPSSPYAASKWASSSYARMFYALYRTPVVIARTSIVYGPTKRQVHKLIPYVIISLLRGETPKLTSGSRKMDLIYVNDVVEGLIAVAEAKGVYGRTIDIGSGEQVSIRSVVKRLVQLVNSKIKPIFGSLPERPFEVSRAADIATTYSMIGWKPAISLNEGLEKTVQWFRSYCGEEMGG